MDTLTHTLVGIGLTGLAMSNPEVAQSPQYQQAIFAATFIGSQGPDLDIIYRIKSKVCYYNNHRGFSHSVPSIIFLSVVTATALKLLFPATSISHLGFWTLVAASIHVGMDLLTPYKINLLQPLTKKKFSWNVVFIVDPFIIITFTIGILGWATGSLNPVPTFTFIFTLTCVYLLMRIIIYFYLLQRLNKQVSSYQGFDCFTIMPKFLPTTWDLILENQQNILAAYVTIFPFKIHFEKCYQKQKDKINLKLIEKTSVIPEIKAFLKDVKHFHVETTLIEEGYLVNWIDIGHRFRDRYPYTATVFVNSNFEMVYVNFGWLCKKKILLSSAEKEVGFKTVFLDFHNDR